VKKVIARNREGFKNLSVKTEGKTLKKEPFCPQEYKRIQN